MSAQPKSGCVHDPETVERHWNGGVTRIQTESIEAVKEDAGYVDDSACPYACVPHVTGKVCESELQQLEEFGKSAQICTGGAAGITLRVIEVPA